MLKTLSYVGCTIEDIKVGEKYCLGQLWDGEGDVNEILDSCSVSPDDYNVIGFEILEIGKDPLDTLVKIKDIY